MTNCDECNQYMTDYIYDEFNGLCYNCAHSQTCDDCLKPITQSKYKAQKGLCNFCFIEKINIKINMEDLE